MFASIIPMLPLIVVLVLIVETEPVGEARELIIVRWTVAAGEEEE